MLSLPGHLAAGIDSLTITCPFFPHTIIARLSTPPKLVTKDSGRKFTAQTRFLNPQPLNPEPSFKGDTKQKSYLAPQTHHSNETKQIHI